MCFVIPRDTWRSSGARGFLRHKAINILLLRSKEPVANGNPDFRVSTRTFQHISSNLSTHRMHHHHHASHLHWLKDDPNPDRVKHDSKDRPGSIQPQRLHKVEPEPRSYAPADVERKKQSQVKE